MNKVDRGNINANCTREQRKPEICRKVDERKQSIACRSLAKHRKREFLGYLYGVDRNGILEFYEPLGFTSLRVH